MTSEGSPYARFRRALTRGNLSAVRVCARELAVVKLDDALGVALLIQRSEPEHYERAAIRWLARLCLERPEVDFDDLAEAMVALTALPEEPVSAKATLAAVCERHHISTRALTG